MNNRSKQSPSMNPYVAGALLGLVLFASFVLTSHGLGASGGLARVAAAAQDVVAPGHVNRTRELAELAGGDKNVFDHWLVWAIGGVLLGGFVSGLLAGRIRPETHKGPAIDTRKRWLLAFVGGGLVGFGARLARGCTSGQALSGGAVLSAGSWAFMLAVFAGGYFLAYPVRKLWN
jgi:hypothetical protein